MEAMNKYGQLIGFIALFSLISCSEGRLYEEFHPFNSSIWAETDSVVFDLSKVESLEGKSLIGIRFNENYPFSNCYVRIILKDSSQSILSNKLLNVPIFDSKAGQPLGEGFGNTYTKYDTLPLSFSKETKEVLLVQYMRKPELEGIEAVGLKILKP
ncbi:gliding motility lipoprotein GldH [Algoriphagus sp. AK58]|nr:gliding motility lipoprotein GldH [Algoriphagus sp. AK58]